MIPRSPTVTPPRTRRRGGGPLPLRAYLVLKYLRTVLAPDRPAPLSNAAICAGVGYGSEGEVSQILRWLAGEQPLAGRWAHRYLDTPQRLRYLRRERRPDGGYTTTLLATPEPLVCADAAPLPISDSAVRQHSDPPTHDPFHDPHCAAPERATTQQTHHDPPADPPATASHGPTPTIERDHAMDSESNQQQQPGQALCHDPLYQHLRAHPGMYPPLAEAIALRRVGSVADFAADLAIGASLPTVRDPFWWVVAIWRTGNRVTLRRPFTQEQPYGPSTGNSHSDAHGAHRTERGAGGDPGRPAARGGAQRGTPHGGARDDGYGVGAAYRAQPAERDLPPFLRQARAHAATS